MTPRTLRNDVLDWLDRERRDPYFVEKVAGVTLVALFALLVAVSVGNVTNEEHQQIAATSSPGVAAQATDPTVELPPVPVGSVANNCEWRTP